MKTFNSLAKYLSQEILRKIAQNNGLGTFAKERAKFEGWLKVEIVGSLSAKRIHAFPEKSYVDISFEGWAIELKTLNTNYNYPNVNTKSKPITDNIQGVIDDINKLKLKKFKNKCIIFIVFPVDQENIKWAKLFNRIRSRTKEIQAFRFNFSNHIPGMLYFGKV